jgi:hypothetical protein
MWVDRNQPNRRKKMVNKNDQIKEGQDAKAILENPVMVKRI